MKKITLFCGALLVAATLLFVACGKDKEATIGKFFKVDNATLVAENMPEATTNQTITVSMNENAIPGGSSYVSVNSEVPARKILVGMRDQVGYYELVPSHSRGNEYSFILLVDQNIALGEGQTVFNVQVAIEDENGDISQIWETNVELKVVGTGALQVSLSFDNAKDVDLHLIEPEYNDEYGEPVSFYDRHIYYFSPYAYNSGGELDLDSNAGCSIDNVNNENITYNDSTAWIPSGTYKVYIDLWENCELDPEYPEIKDLPTNFVVTVFYGGVLIASRSGVFDKDAESTYNPIDEEFVAENEPFLTFNIAGTAKQAPKTFGRAELSESAIEKEANAVHK